MYVDILGGRDVPAAGWYLQAVGRTGRRNTAYRVLAARMVRRRDPRACPRVVMDVETIDEIPTGARVFEFRWYSRKRKRRLTMDEYVSGKVRNGGEK